ncbi:MAG TPA: alkaline phosphatase family protein, partial [Lacipirellulaceae bacterium]
MAFKRYAGKFVNDYAAEYPNSTVQQRREIMGYYPLGFLPALHSLGRKYAVCDQWFSSVPGPTWANRFFVHTGTAMGRTWMPGSKKDIPLMRPYDQPTLYTRLGEKSKRWRIYFGDIPQTFVLTRQLERDNIINYRPMHCFYKDAEDTGTFP